MLEQLKQVVYKANMDLQKYKLVTFTWGNVSVIDRQTGYLAIKPSGVAYENLTPEDIVIMDLNGNKIEGKYNPSSDTKTHIELYKAYENIGSVVHTHSKMAVSWAAAVRNIPNYNTTHSDYFYNDILCTRGLTKTEVNDDYETNTGHVIIEAFKNNNYDVTHNPGVICANHGPFTWGKTASEAVHNAVVLEEIAAMAYFTEMLNSDVKPIPQHICDKHFLRKHGENAYYGQKSRPTTKLEG